MTMMSVDGNVHSLCRFRSFSCYHLWRVGLTMIFLIFILLLLVLDLPTAVIVSLIIYLLMR